jgi:hypothetical protein
MEPTKQPEDHPKRRKSDLVTNNNGNSLLKLLYPLLKGPYAVFVLLILVMWLISTLTPEQYTQLKDFLPYLNSPIGWGVMILGLLVVIYSVAVVPLSGWGKQWLESYIKKEIQHVKVMEEIRDSLGDLKHLVESMVQQLERNHDGISRNNERIERLWEYHVKEGND